MFDTYNEGPQVKCVSLERKPFLVDASFDRRDVHKKYKQELDALYALGEPQPERTTKL